MVALKDIRSSNSRIKTSLPAGLVAVFVGATNGIGETTLREFARYTVAPRVYFVGRSQEAGERIAAECRSLNPAGSFMFIKSDLSLIRNADAVCRQITANEKHINLLWLSQGALIQGVKTDEGMNMAVVLMHHSRIRFMTNLLPQLRRAPGLKRVVSCLAGTKEGSIDFNDFQGWNVPANQIHSYRGHIASVATLCMERLAKEAPEVSFIHAFPGLVRSGIARGTPYSMGLRLMLNLVYPFAAIPTKESGERHLYLMTSARYPAENGREADSGVQLDSPLTPARDTKGKLQGGTYSVDQYLEQQNESALKVLQQLRQDGAVEKAWKLTEEEFVRVTGAS